MKGSVEGPALRKELGHRQLGIITFFPAIFPFRQKGIQAKEEKETF